MKIIMTATLFFSFLGVSFAETHDLSIINGDDNNKYIRLDSDLYKVGSNGELTPVIYAEEDLDPNYSPGTAFSAAIGVYRIVPSLYRIIKHLWRCLSTSKFIQNIRKLFFPRKISEFEKCIIKNSKVVTYNGKNVSQRTTIIDKSKNCGGITSCEAMRNGNAPFSKSCSLIQLHHVLQEDDGLILELTQEEHSQNYADIHKHTNISEINRLEFDKWRRDYWKERGKQLCF